MTPGTHFDGGAFLWLSILLLVAIVAVFAIRAFAAMRVAQSSLASEEAKAKIAQLEAGLADTRTRLSAVEKILNDV